MMQAWDNAPPPTDSDMPPGADIDARLTELEAKVYRGHDLETEDLVERMKQLEERMWTLVKALEATKS